MQTLLLIWRGNMLYYPPLQVIYRHMSNPRSGIAAFVDIDLQGSGTLLQRPRGYWASMDAGLFHGINPALVGVSGADLVEELHNSGAISMDPGSYP